MSKKIDKTIRITCETEAVIDYKKLLNLQENLKTTTSIYIDKLKGSILKYGFTFPVFCWLDKENDKHYIIDAHQRKTALEQLESEGYKIPKIPIVFINAEDKNEAKKKLLLFNSKYSDISQDGFNEYITGIDMSDFEEFLNIPELDFDFTDIPNAEFDLTDSSVIDAINSEFFEVTFTFDINMKEQFDKFERKELQQALLDFVGENTDA